MGGAVSSRPVRKHARPSSPQPQHSTTAPAAFHLPMQPASNESIVPKSHQHLSFNQSAIAQSTDASLLVLSAADEPPHRRAVLQPSLEVPTDRKGYQRRWLVDTQDSDDDDGNEEEERLGRASDRSGGREHTTPACPTLTIAATPDSSSQPLRRIRASFQQLSRTIAGYDPASNADASQKPLKIIRKRRQRCAVLRPLLPNTTQYGCSRSPSVSSGGSRCSISRPPHRVLSALALH